MNCSEDDQEIPCYSKMGAENQRWVHLTLAVAVIAADLVQYASHRPNGHLVLRDLIVCEKQTAEAI